MLTKRGATALHVVKVFNAPRRNPRGAVLAASECALMCDCGSREQLSPKRAVGGREIGIGIHVLVGDALIGIAANEFLQIPSSDLRVCPRERKN